MLRNLRKTLSVLVAVVLLLQCLPVAALGEIVKNSQSVRLIDPEEGNTNVYVTYEFYNDETMVDYQIVNQTKGQTPTLTPATPSLDAGKEFDGWYYEEDGAAYETGVLTNYTESKTRKVVAKFTDVFYVYFMSADASPYVHATQKATADNDYKVTLPTDYMPADARVTGWKLVDGSVFTADTVVTADTYVYPITTPCYWVTFDTQGGT